MMKNLTLRARLLLLSSTALISILLLSIFLSSHIWTILYNDRVAKTRSVVEVAHSLIEGYAQRVSRGELSEEQAKEQALKALAVIRYEGNEYFWVNDMSLKMVMHPIKPDLNGQLLADFKDPNGVLLFREFLRVVQQQGAGFVSYQWPKPGAQDPVEKISYVSGFKPWGWIVGSGVYVDDIKTIFLEEVELITGGLVGISIVVLLIAAIIQKSILSSTRQIMGIMEQVRESGDLTLRVRLEEQSEFGLLANDLNRLLESLHGFVMQIKQIASNLDREATEISRLAQTNAQLMSEQRLQTDQVAVAMNEMSSTVESVALSAVEASTVATRVDQLASKGSGIVQSAMEAINRLAQEIEKSSEVIGSLKEGSEGIGSVLDVIGGIAEQTNLLALNAAIEAARAGEQGRGFAVVADEVRNLASRTQQSTQEIQNMITALQNRAAHAVGTMADGRQQALVGVDKAHLAGEALQQITLAARQINDMNAQIASASEEQSHVAHEIDHSVIAIAAAADKTASMAKVNCQQSESLAVLSTQLKQLTAGYSTVAG